MWEHLVENEVAGRAFPDAMGSKELVKINIEYLNNESFREELIEDLCILEVGPKITSHSSLSHDEATSTVTTDEQEGTGFKLK